MKLGLFAFSFFGCFWLASCSSHVVPVAVESISGTTTPSPEIKVKYSLYQYRVPGFEAFEHSIGPNSIDSTDLRIQAAVTGATMYLCGDTGSILKVMDVGRNLPKGAFDASFGTEGYVRYMLAQKQTTGQMMIYLSLGEGNYFKAPLPDLQSQVRGPIALQFQRSVEGLPAIKGIAPHRVDGPFMMPTMTIYRTDDHQSIFYYYYLRSPNDPIRLTTKSSEWEDSAGDLWQDLGRIGLSKESPLAEIAVAPPDGI